jgi:hypothetical protein
MPSKKAPTPLENSVSPVNAASAFAQPWSAAAGRKAESPACIAGSSKSGASTTNTQ